MAVVRHIACGPYVNESERVAVERLKSKLQSLPTGTWLLLSNLNNAGKQHQLSDEIDLIVIGPPGISVVEIKHWDASFLKQRSFEVELEAEKLNAKAKRVKGKISAAFDPGFIAGKMLLTRGELRYAGQTRPDFRGIAVFGLPEWTELLSTGAASRLTPAQIDRAGKLLEPMIKVALDGDLRSFGQLVNLERLSSKSEIFHRVYRGLHSTRRDRVVLHLYDLSATSEKQAEERARREFEVIQRWQKSPYVPNLLDSFQEADGYPGELYYFSLVDPAAPPLAERQKDTSWTAVERLQFARAALAALDRFHRPDDPELPGLVHRRLSPQCLRVRHNGDPLFTDFSLTRIAEGQTISAVPVDFGSLAPFVAPEVQDGGLAAADARSDVFALCATLAPALAAEDPLLNRAREILQLGLSHNADGRHSAGDLADEFGRLLDQASAPAPAAELPDPAYWDEDTVVPFQNSRYKILGRLGQGGIGQTFKVVEVDARSEELYGTYVAKVIRHLEDGGRALRAYRKARAHTSHPHLSAIYEIAPEWQPNRFVALMKWVEGMPLQDLFGVLPLYAEDIGEKSAEALALRWLGDICSALAELHGAGLVHGDVSPRNIIVHGGEVVLTDYDTVTDAGQRPQGGTLIYSSPAVERGTEIEAADDVYSLAASFFNLLFDRDPFLRGSERNKALGLCWEGIDQSTFPVVCVFLERATRPVAGERLSDGEAAAVFVDRIGCLGE